MTLRNWSAAMLLFFWGYAAAAEDFFQITEDKPSRAVEDTGGGVEFSGSLTHRFHYALTNQRDQFAFRREGTGAVSNRYDLLLEARYRSENNVNMQLAGLASYDAELEDASYMEVDQSYIEWGPTPSLNIKSGRQIISLGESNYFQLADRINPVDERAFGLSELSETLLPVAASRLSYYQSRWGVDLIALHEFRPNHYDEPYGDFDPYIEFRDMPLEIQENRPDVSLTSPDVAGRFFLSRPWGDIALFASRLHGREARPTAVSENTLHFDYSELTLMGASANRVLGSWLLKSEYAYSDGDLYLRDYSGERAMQDSNALSVTGSTHRWMVGGRYTGARNLTLDLEILSSHIVSVDGPLGEDRTQLKGVASIERQMLNEKLVANLTYMGWEDNLASMVRVRLDYALQDDVVVFAGAVNYSASAEDQMLAPYRNNDRMFVGFTLSF
ncbi:DUF1302 domain-containing protein [Billgrantia montanilacus]|nr:DUF1302 domain-containing protein [Halomonas montanilacus]